MFWYTPAMLGQYVVAWNAPQLCYGLLVKKGLEYYLLDARFLYINP